MKKTIFSVCIALAANSLQAQCMIDMTTGNGVYPTAATNLPVAYVEQAYSTTLQFKVPADTATALGTFPITQIEVDSVTGLPDNFSYQTNPSDNVFPGGSHGCILITGNPTTDQLVGGPDGNGVFPISVYFTATVGVFSIPTAFPYDYSGYKIQIVSPSAVQDDQLQAFYVSAPLPNPATGSTDFVFNNTQATEMDFKLYDGLGHEMFQEKLSTHQGENTFHLNLQSFKSGIYLYSFRQGQKLVTQRLVIE